MTDGPKNEAALKTLERETGLESGHWQSLIGPLFLEMYRRGVKRVTIEKVGACSNVVFEMEAEV